MSEAEGGASDKELAYAIYEAGFCDGREFPMMDTRKAFDEWWRTSEEVLSDSLSSLGQNSKSMSRD